VKQIRWRCFACAGVLSCETDTLVLCCLRWRAGRYGLADNEDNIPDIIRSGALQRLMDACDKLSMQASKVRGSSLCLFVCERIMSCSLRMMHAWMFHGSSK
jgi:hypothetical protein